MFLIDQNINLDTMHWDIVAAVSAVVLFLLGGSIVMRWYLYREDKQSN